ncbi:MAG: DUF1073 domain-containing protein [Melioribacteraceae bacterium]|jgi:hypothetical protein|nr:DUF1073 domain-containing protein [Melioribacteraceae bacterium]
MSSKYKKIIGLTEQEKIINKLIRPLANSLVSRSAYSGIGSSYISSSTGEVKRDIYKILGYKKALTFLDYYDRYRRGDIAQPIVNAPVEYSWRQAPIVIEQESKNEQTPFEKAWSDLVSKKKILNHFMKVDRKAGVGQFALLFIGVNDNRPVNEEMGKATDILYVKEYYEQSVEIAEYEEDTKNPRFGLPKIYRILVRDPATSTSTSATAIQNISVHWSRCVHVYEGLSEDNICGEPRLQSVFNRLQDLDQLAGGASEMFWRGAFPGFAFAAREDAEFDESALDSLEEEIQGYMHELKRYIRLQGIDVQPLATQVESPKDHADLLITLIAAGRQIPKRILLGSERGELASSQDERSWLSKMEARRIEYNEPIILRPTISVLTSCGILPAPKKDYTIEWPSLISVEPKDDAEVKRLRMEVAKAYVSTPGLRELIPEDFFLRKFQDFTMEDIEEIKDMLAEMQDYTMTDDEDEDDNSTGEDI